MKIERYHGRTGDDVIYDPSGDLVFYKDHLAALAQAVREERERILGAADSTTYNDLYKRAEQIVKLLMVGFFEDGKNRREIERTIETAEQIIVGHFLEIRREAITPHDERETNP